LHKKKTLYGDKGEFYSNKLSWGVTENRPYFLLCGVHIYLHLGRLVHMQYGWLKFSLGTLVHLLEARLVSTGALPTENFLCCC